MAEVYDTIIIGGGPAGLTAAIYAKRANLSVVLIEKQTIGGQISITDKVKNYPGFAEINGADFCMKLIEQAQVLGIEIIYDTVVGYKLKGNVKEISTPGGTYKGRTVILSMGASAKGLNLPNEQNYIGRGISYCAVCDGTFFKGRNVVVVGGGNSALQDVLYLSKLADKVTHIHRRHEFTADIENIRSVSALAKDGNIEQILGATVTAILGKDKVEGVRIYLEDGGEREVAADGIFIAVGRHPQTADVEGVIELDERGYIKSNNKLETNIPGVFCAGDIVAKDLRQIVTATSDGAVAAMQAGSYIRQQTK